MDSEAGGGVRRISRRRRPDEVRRTENAPVRISLIAYLPLLQNVASLAFVNRAMPFDTSTVSSLIFKTSAVLSMNASYSTAVILTERAISSFDGSSLERSVSMRAGASM